MVETPMNPHVFELLVLSLGSNVGDRTGFIQEAIEQIESELKQKAIVSSYLETEPWGNTNQNKFINVAAAIPCNWNPKVLLDTLLQIEVRLGRIRDKKWGPRCIDIDILFYGNMIYQSDFLEIPHPYIAERDFVLNPLAEILPDFVHPVLGKSIKHLADELQKN
jgi:2-amino-4-hydroxy-6-hydroxymethyldihydropteridine diphosphokinase